MDSTPQTHTLYSLNLIRLELEVPGWMWYRGFLAAGPPSPSPAPWAWLGEDRASPREDAKLPRGRSFHACAPKVLQAAKGCFVLGFREVRSSVGSFSWFMGF